MAQKTPQKLMQELGINTCGECKFFKRNEMSCVRDSVVFPSMKSDPACGHFISSKEKG